MSGRISVSGATYALLRAEADRLCISMAQVLYNILGDASTWSSSVDATVMRMGQREHRAYPNSNTRDTIELVVSTELAYQLETMSAGSPLRKRLLFERALERALEEDEANPEAARRRICRDTEQLARTGDSSAS